MGATVIAVLNQKGGCGKTTIATTLARGLQLGGASVLIADADPQHTVSDWYRADEEAERPDVFSAAREMNRLPDLRKARYDYVVIDGPPRLLDFTPAVKAAHLVVIPVRHSAADLWAIRPLVDYVVSQKQKAVFVVSMERARSRLASEIGSALKGYGLPVLKARTGDRVAYTDALGQGLTVFDTKPPSSKAHKEAKALVREIKRYL